jgi:exodeoxyribonuclease-3
MNIISFNVNGIRAITNKDFIVDMKTVDADVICLQEIKATEAQVHEALKDFSNYHIYVNDADNRKGYSGTAILSKTEPISVVNHIGIEEHDQEGRVICAEYDTFYLITVYVPNSGSELLRLEYRQKWDIDFLAYLKNLESKKPVVVCGDFNVAHKDFDLARPKPNYNKSAGYMQKEIDGMNAYISNGFVDSYRYFHPETEKYSWWSYRAGARIKNIGWRIDYFLVSEVFMPQVIEADILIDILGSDHCPVGIKIKI